jgi:hypothetical protein
VQVIRFARCARRHRIGKARARYVMEHHTADVSVSDQTGDMVRPWLGADDRGIVLEVVAIEKPG